MLTFVLNFSRCWAVVVACHLLLAMWKEMLLCYREGAEGDCWKRCFKAERWIQTLQLVQLEMKSTPAKPLYYLYGL